MDGTYHPPFSANKLAIIASVVVLAVACTVAAVFAQTGAIMIDVGKMTVGASPADFDFARTGKGAPGSWAVVEDATAEGGRAIEQTSSEKTDYRFPLAIYKPLSARDVEVSLRFKPVGGKVDRAGGIAVRLSDPDNYYVVRANALEDNVRFYRVVNGRRQQLAGVDLNVKAEVWHTLTLRAEEQRFVVTFDGQALFTAMDGTFSAAGKVALWTKADSVTRFDSIKIARLR